MSALPSRRRSREPMASRSRLGFGRQFPGPHIGTHAGSTISSTSGGSSVTAGSNATAVLTSANGVALNMVSTNVTSTGGATLTLTTGAQALGYNGAAIEIKSTLAINGGLANFTLNEGAVFQVGANAGQTVGADHPERGFDRTRPQRQRHADQPR